MTVAEAALSIVMGAIVWSYWRVYDRMRSAEKKLSENRHKIAGPWVREDEVVLPQEEYERAMEAVAIVHAASESRDPLYRQAARVVREQCASCGRRCIHCANKRARKEGANA